MRGFADTTAHFVYDGPGRYLALIYPYIEATVKAEFAERIAQASWHQRLRLRWLIHCEIHRRVKAAVSDLAL